VTAAVIFDLDGVLVDSEQLWDQARREFTAQHGGHWLPGATTAMQGMSSVEWSGYLRWTLGVQLPEPEIAELVAERLLDLYETKLPLLPGAAGAVRRIGSRWPLGLASSSNRSVIDTVLDRAALRPLFAATVSSEEVRRGKPAPDVYLEAARRLGYPPQSCAAVEDSANGIRSAVAAGMLVAAIPNRQFPPPADVLATADLALNGLDELTVQALEDADSGRSRAPG
jgi:HAD superfamily hydrolase (TIGR01509 family)